MRWRELNRSDSKVGGDEEGPVVLAGEWIGSGIQKGVAIAQLRQKCFVLCSIKVGSDGIWEGMDEYADVTDRQAGILNISTGGLYYQTFDRTDDGAAFMAEAKRLTMEVDASCPFGKALGLEGRGEGIVWVPAADSDLPNISDFWLKTKGEQFAVTKPTPKPKPTAEQLDLRDRAKAFVAATCTPPRMEQGWQYLAEMGIEQSMKGMGAFLKWIVSDIEVEEKREIAEEKLGNAWKAEVSRMAKGWFETRVREEKDG